MLREGASPPEAPSPLPPPHEAGGEPRLAHEGALDGLRGVAILAVLLYHGDLSLGQAGYFGVEAFFVLSGFLITSLLLAEWTGSGRVRLGRFWARRARRLLPALFCLVAAVAIRQAIVGPNGAVPDFAMDGISTLFYFANWHEIATGTGYFAQTAVPSPLQHTWSLAIEEQFYVFWPLLLVAVLGLANRAGRKRLHSHGRVEQRPRLWPLLALSAFGALASATEMGVLYHLGTPLERVWIYYGTDTRAEGLLSGATLAVGLAIWRAKRSRGSEGASEPERRRSRGGSVAWVVLQVAGLAALAGFVALVLVGQGDPGRLYEGGFLAVDVGVAIVIASFVAGRRASITRAVLSFWPLRATGLISYGLYLWHYPVFLWLDDADTGLSGWRLFLVRLGVSFGAAIVSYFVVEQPVRQRRIPLVLTRALGVVGVSGALAAVLVASSVDAAVPLPPAGPAVTTTVPARLTGRPTVRCRVRLPGAFKAYATFHTCPPERVMMIGDSVGQSLGFELSVNEESYGVLLANDTLLGCGFIETGEVGAPGSFSEMDPPCYSADRTWAADVRRFRPQVVVVEMGWWDSMDHLIEGEDVYLGEPSYDGYLVRRIDALVDEMDRYGAKVVLLSVPWMLPPPWPNGEEMPAALGYRHGLVNDLLHEAARARAGKAYYFDIGPEVTPANRFQADVGGSICRTSDGIHFYFGSDVFHIRQTDCGARLQAALLPFVRSLEPPARRP